MSNEEEDGSTSAAMVRGRYLLMTIEMENTLTEIISHYFCANEQRRTALISFIIEDKMMLGKKIDIFESILKLSYPEMVVENPDLIRKLKNINSFRVKFAHYAEPLGIKVTKKDTTMKLVYYENGILKTTEIDLDKILDAITDMIPTLKVLLALLSKLKEGKKGSIAL